MPVGYPAVPNPYQPRNPYTSGASQNVQDIYKNQTGSWGHNAGNPFGQPIQAVPSPGVNSWQTQATMQPMKLLQPQQPMEWSTPAQPQSPMRLEAPQGPQDVTPYSGGLMPQFNPTAPMPGYQAPGFQTQYGTQQNVEAYMNPYLDQIINRGNQAIQSSAAARGLLGSSGTLNNIGDWTAQATANEYGNAFNRFNQDRGYMTDTFRDSRDFDYRNFRDTNAWNYGLFTDERDDFNSRMQDWYNQMQGISNTGFNASANAGTIQSNLGQALAQLYGNQGNVGAAQAMAQGNNNSGLLGAFFNLIPLLG